MPTVLSLFTGGGGLDLGFEQAGFEIVGVVEKDRDCIETLRRNRPLWCLLETDVRLFRPTGLDVDVLVAGPPCQGFSTAGLRDPTDHRNQLYREVIRVARKTKPHAIIVENVPGLETMQTPSTARAFDLQIAGDLEVLGYTVNYARLATAAFGVPQTRRRTIFIALRGRRRQCPMPVPRPEDAVVAARPFLEDLQELPPGILPNHDPVWTPPTAIPDVPIIAIRRGRSTGTSSPIRDLDGLFPTVDTSTPWSWAQNVRATQQDGRWRVEAARSRPFTVREYARLQTFPDAWEFAGNKVDARSQIGNAVPVVFARRLAEHVATLMDAEKKTARRRTSGPSISGEEPAVSLPKSLSKK